MNTYQTAEQFFQYKNINYRIESNGRELRILCPFCNNPKQKCYVESTTGRFYCHHCGEGGGWKGLAERLGNPDAAIPEQPIRDKEDEPDLPPINPEIIKQNHQRLFEPAQKPILEYLHNRLLTNETIKKFKLGWDGKNITIPIFDANGDCMNFRLKRDPTLKSGSKGMYSILGRGRKRLFNEVVLKSKPESIIICEGEWDCMLLTQYGYTAVTSTAGAKSFDESWVDAFQEIEKVSLCYDIDRNGSGQQGAVKTAQLFYEKGEEVYIVNLEKPSDIEQKTDVTDFFVKYGEKAQDKFSKLLQNAKVYKPKEEVKISSGKPTVASKLIKLTLDLQCDIFLDEFSEPHISFPDKPIIGYPVKSSELRWFLASLLYEKEKKGFSGETFQQVANTLEGFAFHQKKVRKLYNRLARIDDIIYYDLGNNINVVAIDKNGWEIISKCPVKFKRYPHQVPQVIPEKDGNLYELAPFINLTHEKDLLLYFAHIVVTLVPNIGKAALAAIGDYGSAKTTALRIILTLVDPSKDLLKLTNNIDQIILTANKHYCLYYDNLSYLSNEISDTFSALVTGISLESRKLYTNNESVIFSQKVAIGFSSIPLVANKSDLLSRLLILRFSEIPEDKRLPEELFWEKFNLVKPKILGAIFDCLSKTLAIQSTLTLSNLPRMADYGKYGAAAAIGLGKTAEDFLTAFNENIHRQNEAAIDASPVAQTIEIFMADKQEWSDSSTGLHAILFKIATENNMEINSKDGFPRHANKLWPRISPIKQNLKRIGILISHSRASGHATITISKVSSNSNKEYTGYTEDNQPTSEPTPTYTKK